jgi:hypothetical protein
MFTGESRKELDALCHPIVYQNNANCFQSLTQLVKGTADGTYSCVPTFEYIMETTGPLRTYKLRGRCVESAVRCGNYQPSCVQV